MIISLIVVPAVVVVAVIGLWLRSPSGTAADGPLQGQLRGTYPTRPTAGWTLGADDIVRGSVFVLPDAMAHTYSAPGFIDLGDRLVTAAIDPDSKAGTLVGIDSATGEVAWRNSDVGDQPICAAEVVKGLLPCLRRAHRGADDRLPPSTLYLVRVADGVIDREVQFRAAASALLVHGSDLYSLGYQSMAKGTIYDPTASWQRDYSASSESGCIGSGDSHYFGVNDDIVYYGSDIGVTVADAHTGSRLTEQDLQGAQLFGTNGFAGRLCVEEDPSIGRVDIVGIDGNVLHTVDRDAWVVEPWLVAEPAAVPVILGGAAYDFHSGEQLWSADGGVLGPAAIIGDTVVGRLQGTQHSVEEARTVGLDLATGEQIWSNSAKGSLTLSDGQNVMLGDSDSVSAIDLRTGESVWTLPVSAYHVGVAGEGFASAEPERLTYYPPTGGPSVAPGTAQVPALEADPAGGPITKCGTEPELKPVEYRAENGGLVVKMEFKATCSSGDIIAGDRFRVTIRDGESMIASGTFDFSDDPLVLGGAGSPPTTVDLTFSEGTIWRLPNTLGVRDAGGSGEIVTTAKASGNELVDCEDEGGDSGPASVDQQPQAPRSPKVTVGGDAPCSDGEALAALRVQVDSDRPFVQAGLADRWVAQLSAKQPGLVAAEVDGRMVTWTPCEILRQHLRMRLQYPEVRLVWSDEWRTFDLRGWWVTIAGVTFPDPDAANGWCDQRSIAVTECFAKVVSNSRDSRGGTKYRR